MNSDDRPVLIIDDDSFTRYALGRLVRRAGRYALGASTLAAGLALLETEPDCVVLDLNLPDGRGEAVLRAVRARHLPCRVAVCSGEADPLRLERLKRLLPDAVLAKPVSADEFVAFCRGPSAGPVTPDTPAPAWGQDS